MNFFNIGFVLCAFGANLGTEMNYLPRLAGTFFMLGGIREIDSYLGKPDFRGHRPAELGIMLLSAAGLVQALMIRFGALSEGAGNIVSIVIAAILTAAVLADQYLILRKIVPDRDLVNDPSLLVKLDKAWKGYGVFAAVSVIAEISGRLLPFGSSEALFAAVVLIVTRLMMYIYLAVMGTAFNRCRMDFNAIHPA